MMDLGHKMGGEIKPATPKRENKKYYPSLHVSDLKEEVEEGDEVTIKGRVRSSTKSSRGGKTTYSAEIECHGMECKGMKEGGLEGALDRIAAKKSRPMMDDMD